MSVINVHGEKVKIKEVASLLTFQYHKQLNTHKRTQTHASGKTPLTEWSELRRGRYLHNTKQKQETYNHALSGIRDPYLANQAATDLRLRTGMAPEF